MLCKDPRCGAPAGRGHPRTGWLCLHEAGSSRPDLWFCGRSCLSYALTGDVDAFPVRPPLTSAPPTGVSDALAELNRLAGCHLSIMTATPARVRHALDHAFSRLVSAVETQAVADAKDRPTIQALIEEIA